MYIGGFVGGAGGGSDWTYPNGNPTNVSWGGVLLGGEVGYNYQAGPWVYGIEGDLGGVMELAASPRHVLAGVSILSFTRANFEGIGCRR